MGSSYFGELSIGGGSNGRSTSSGSGSGSSSKKGKKSNSDKPKQPQRGLGVAQLEKIRLHQQLGCAYVPPNSPFHHQEDVRVLETTYSSIPSSSYSSSPSYGYQSQHHHPNIMMGYREMEGSDVRYVDSQACNTTRWSNQNNGLFGGQYATQPGMTRPLMSFNLEDSAQTKKTRKDRCNSMGSSSQYSGEYSNDTQEIDLDLKLSL
ncbi:hypothetical protein MKX03_013659 [Papaver bracteatum]|nr:hypothetical protein MKX03_013659 [Papaver bracteatum]